MIERIAPKPYDFIGLGIEFPTDLPDSATLTEVFEASITKNPAEICAELLLGDSNDLFWKALDTTREESIIIGERRMDIIIGYLEIPRIILDTMPYPARYYSRQEIDNLLLQRQEYDFMGTISDSFFVDPSGRMALRIYYENMLVNGATNFVKNGLREGIKRYNQYFDYFVEEGVFQNNPASSA